MSPSFPSMKKNGGHFLISMAVAAVIVALLWLVHKWLPMPRETSGFFNLPALRFKLFDSGPIPFVILGTFLAGLIDLAWIWWSRLRSLRGMGEQDHAYLSRHLVRLMARFSRDRDLSAVISLKNDLLDIDEEEFSLAFTWVRWSEAALPLLGFLGTVVGIGDAMGGVSTAVRSLFRGESPEAALADLNRGFAGMALAFDTTFLGLAGVMIIGILHMTLRKGLAVRLATARNLLTGVVAGWEGGNSADSVVVAISEMEVHLQRSDVRLQALEEAVRESDRRATQFREDTLELVERVIREAEVPGIKSIRNVLYRPVVMFQSVGGDLAEGIRRYLDGQLGRGWVLRSLGVSTTGGHAGVAALESRDKSCWLLPFDLAGPYEGPLYKVDGACRDLWALGDARTVLGFACTNGHDKKAGPPAEGLARLVLNGAQGSPAADERRLVEGTGSDDRLLPIRLEGEDRILFLRRLAHQGGVEAHLSSGSGMTRLTKLPSGFRWTQFSTHADSGSLFALGESLQGGAACLSYAQLTYEALKQDGESEKKGTEKPKSPAPRQITLRFDHELRLPKRFTAKGLMAVDKDLVLLLDETGRLHYWDTKSGEPRLLSHPDWKPVPGCTLRAGRGGWFAVAADETLSMWQVHRGGSLHRYEDTPELAIQNVAPDSFRATLDGRYLFAIGPRAIFTWEFPRYAIDQF